MRKADGFSLVEVLIAAAILAVALLAIASMFPIAHTNVDWSGDQTVAVTLAQQRIETLRNQPYIALAAGTTTETAIPGLRGLVQKANDAILAPLNPVEREVPGSTPSAAGPPR